MKKTRYPIGKGFLFLNDQVWSPHVLYPFRVMATLIILSFSVFFQVVQGAPAGTRPKQISLVKEAISIKDALKELEKQTEYRFFYNSHQINTQAKIDVNLRLVTIDEALGAIFRNSGIDYRISGRQILLYSRHEIKGGSSRLEPLRIDPGISPVQFTVKGSVKTVSGEAVPGVNILLKNTATGTITDNNGEYSLTLPDGSGILVFSFIGYVTQEIQVSGRSTLDVVLEEDKQSLEEVVVVGYGTQRKRELTSAVASIDHSKIADLKVSSFSEALVGQVSGVQISQVNGGPGTPLNVRIRGTGSITAGNNPLYVVDGFPLSVEGLSTLNMSDIESIEILKDASATAIYGSRGSNGVVLVTTKRGSTGKTRIEFGAYTGIQQLSKKVDVLNPDEYVELAIEAIQNAWIGRGGKPDDPNSARPALYQIAPYFLSPEKWTRTDWQDEIYRPAPISDYNLSASGGTEKMKYMVSAGYFNQRGILLNTGFKRYSGRLNLDGELTDRVRFNINFSPTFSTSDKVQGDGRWVSGAVGNALALPGFFPVRNEDGTYPSFHGFGYNSSTAYNPVSLVEQATGVDKTLRVLGNANISVDLLKGLTYTLNGGVDFNNRENSFYMSTLIPLGGALSPGGNFSTNSNSSWVMENTVSYTREFSDHRFNFLIGQSAQSSHTTQSAIVTNNYPNDLVKTLNAGQVVSGNTTESEWALASYFSRLTYAYEDKYYLNAAIRRDGSSRFGENRRWGVFPSVSAGWRVSGENFLKNSTLIDELKIRTSYGVTGNNFISNYGSIGLLSSANYVFANSIVNARVPSTFSNALLSWETSRQFDAGLDLRVLKGRIELVYDFYSKVNSDLLLNVPVPSITGVTASLRNIGSVRNQGMEWTLTTRNLVGKFSWMTSFNISYNRNKVLALGPGGDPIITKGSGGAVGNATHITQIGKPMGSFYGFVFEGIYNTNDEIASKPHLPTDRPGDPIIKDVNGDDAITMDDRTIIGNNVPDYIFGLDNTFRYKNFDLRIFFNGVQGCEILNLTKEGVGIIHGRINQLGEARDRWKSPEEPGNGKVFRANLDINGYRRLMSTRYVEDASYIRLRNITLGYAFSPSLLQKLKISQMRLFITGQNLMTLTRYTMYNPEAVSGEYNSPLTPGSDTDVYPLARTYMIGLNLTF